MAALGHPIVGDKLYTLGEDLFIEWRKNPEEIQKLLPMKRHALHCTSVEFLHPFTSDTCSIEAPLPSDMDEFIHDRQ